MRRLSSLALLAVLSGTAAACDLSPPAATVAGSTITRSQLDAQLSAVATSAYAQCALELQGETLPSSVTGAGADTVSSQLAAAELSTLVLEDLVSSALDRQGHPVTAADLADARADLAAQVTPGAGSANPCPNGLAGQGLLARLPAGFRTEEVRLLADEEQLAVSIGHVDISPSALRSYYSAHPTQFQEVCLSDIAVETQAEAQSIRSAIVSGAASFAAEAVQNSVDSETAADGGQLPCLPTSEVLNTVILDAISTLAVGQVSQPVFENTGSSGGGGVWFLLEMDGRPSVPFTEAEPEIRQQLLSTAASAVSADLTRLAKAAHVTIDPRYGTWSALSGVEPPATPPADDLLSPTADVSGASSSSSASSASGGGSG